MVDDGTYYLFFEAYKSGGVQTICYATSADGLAWTFGGEVLNSTITGSTQLSYPQVIYVDGDWYMMPTSSNDAITLYKATTFPTAWERVDNVITGNYNPRDATIFQYNSVFYILVWDGINNTLRLFYSDYLFGTGVWKEHSSSPILSGDRNSRPGGRPIVSESSVDIFLQDSVTSYGNKLRIYRITSLSKTACEVSELETSPILDASGSGWNSRGMHQLDRINGTVSFVDGKDVNSIWSIGIYQDVAP